MYRHVCFSINNSFELLHLFRSVYIIVLIDIINKAIVVLINITFVVILLMNNKLIIDIAYILCNIYSTSCLF